MGLTIKRKTSFVALHSRFEAEYNMKEARKQSREIDNAVTGRQFPMTQIK